MEVKSLGQIIKRVFDVIISTAILIILSPLLIVIGILIKIDSQGKVFFLQERAGINGKPFMIYKFRTMCNNAEKKGEGYYTSENDPRITRVGKFLRNTSLDELPQLFNIIKGDMSLIGPRPTLMYQIKEYDSFQLKRLDTLPGVTGLAQVNGRNSLSWPQRIQYDVWYVENWSILLDIKIFLKTFIVIFKRQGIYAEKSNFIIKENNSSNDKDGVGL